MVSTSELLPNASQATPPAAFLSLAWDALDLNPYLRQRRWTTAYICKLKVSSCNNQQKHSIAVAWWGIAESAYLLDWAATCQYTQYIRLERRTRRLTAVALKPFLWLKPPVAQGGTAAAAHMERGELVTVRSLVAAESQERTAGHHRKQQEKLVADQARLLDIPHARSCWLAKACNLPVSVLSRCFLLTVLGTVTYWLP